MFQNVFEDVELSIRLGCSAAPRKRSFTLSSSSAVRSEALFSARLIEDGSECPL